MVKWVKGLGVRGFLAAGIAGGIKGKGSKDLGLIVSEIPARAVGVFTTNRVKAAPVLVSQRRVRKGVAQAILVNSGCANACTGKRGLNDVYRLSKVTARLLGLPAPSVLVSSTGMIGVPLPAARLEKAVGRLVKSLSPGGLEAFAEAILTTDTRSKVSVRRGVIGGEPVTVCGVAKGAGMIMPRMATTLGFVVTDCAVSLGLLKDIVRKAVAGSFNKITIDGDTSTNDSILVLANGAAGNREVTGSSEDRERLQAMISGVLMDLAQMVVKDAEGATKFIALEVRGARTSREAEAVAFAVANSYLVKAALYGGLPNWGRIMACIGRSGSIQPGRVDIGINGLPVVRGGEAIEKLALKRLKTLLRRRTIDIQVDLNQGAGSAKVWTSDLTPEYVRINASLRS
jgi:glutamate N-acetyltransferase/amino-acid N-acetyltransferase